MREKLDLSDLLVRNIEGWELLERFWVATVVSILVIRAFLRITGNPQIRFGGIHIAHVLFGGIVMLISIVMLLIFIDRRSRFNAAVIGGVGFGMFVDELGKFVTRDNNYWFRPTIALIYLVLVLLFILFRQIARNVKLHEKEYAVNALEFAKEIVIYDLDREERRKAMLILKEANQDDPIVKLLKKTFKDMKHIKTFKKSHYVLFKQKLRVLYKHLVSKNWFNSFVVLFFVVKTLLSFIEALINVRSTSGFFEWGLFLSITLSAVFVLVGASFVQREDMSTAYDFFKVSLLISIFLTRFFLFYFEQLSATGGLLVDVLILSVLQYLIDQYNLKRKKDVVLSGF